jgi:hypothetical protein
MPGRVHYSGRTCVVCVSLARKGCNVWWLCGMVMTVDRVLQVRRKLAWAQGLEAKNAD